MNMLWKVISFLSPDIKDLACILILKCVNIKVTNLNGVDKGNFH